MDTNDATRKSSKHAENATLRETPQYIAADTDSVEDGTTQAVDHLHRSLSNRQIQWIAIGGSIGTALFVSIGFGLVEGGPASLLLGFILYSCALALVNSCMAEMAVFMPVSGSWVRMASKWIDEALGFTAGWNFFLYEAILIRK